MDQGILIALTNYDSTKADRKVDLFYGLSTAMYGDIMPRTVTKP